MCGNVDYKESSPRTWRSSWGKKCISTLWGRRRRIFPSAIFPYCPKETTGLGHSEEVFLSPKNVFPDASFDFFLITSWIFKANISCPVLRAFKVFLVSKFICVIFRKKWSSCWGTNSLNNLKQKLLLWKDTGCSSARLPASLTWCSSCFWLLSCFPPSSQEQGNLGMHIMRNFGLEIKCWTSRRPMPTWPKSDCLTDQQMFAPLLCQAGFSCCHPWAKGHEEHGGETQLTPEIPQIMLTRKMATDTVEWSPVRLGYCYWKRNCFLAFLCDEAWWEFRIWV